MSNPKSTYSLGLIIFLLICVSAAAYGVFPSPARTVRAHADDHSVTILLTAHPRDKKDQEKAASLKEEDIAVKENGRPQKVLSLKSAAEVPPTVEVLIEDRLSPRFDSELAGIRKFIQDLPNGSRVLTGYITTGALSVRQDFTTDRDQAARSLRVLNHLGSGNLYFEVTEGLKKFDSQPEGRRILVLISAGLDISQGFEQSNPDLSPDLRRAIREAQSRRVAVFTMFYDATPASLVRSLGTAQAEFGPGSLIKLSDETGGESFVGPQDTVSLTTYWEQLRDMMDNQWLLTYESASKGSGLRRIKVSTETGLRLRYQTAYSLK